MAGRPILGGIVAGMALALAAGFVLRRNLFGLSPFDPASFVAVAAILGMAAIVATYVPVRRALRVDPASTLRSD